jgi:hypothetical protein
MKQGANLTGLMMCVLLQACGASVESSSEDSLYDPEYAYSGATEKGARIIFHRNFFTNLDDFTTFQQTRYQCLGDVTQVFKVSGEDYTGSPTLFDVASASDAFYPTYKPDFLRNVSVDITNAFYETTQVNVIQTDACSYRLSSVPTSPCADFDWDGASGVPDPAPTITPTPTPVPTPFPVATPAAPPYVANHGFYRVRDPWCAGQGVIQSNDPEHTKSHVGGVSIDLNRSRLGSREDLLMVLTYQAFREGKTWPYGTSAEMEANDETWLQVNLIATSLSLENLLGLNQPRAWSDYENPAMPVYYKTLATFRDSYSALRTEQLVIPLSQNGLIDRIRIERVRGSFHLYQLDLYRLGNRE